MHPIVAANPDLFSLDVPAQSAPVEADVAPVEVPAEKPVRRGGRRKAEGDAPAKTSRRRKTEPADGEAAPKRGRRKTDDAAPAKPRARRAAAKPAQPEPEPETRPEVLAVAQDTSCVLAIAIERELQRHPKKGRRRVEAERTEQTVQFGPKYARELVSTLMALADKHIVHPVPRPVAGPDKYGKGAEVVLIGLKGDIARLMTKWERVVTITAELLEGKHAPAPVDGGPVQEGRPLAGEDPATFRSSLLLGFRLGLLDPDLNRDHVEATVRGENGPQGAAWKSTGSGAWFGYETALRLVTLAAQTPAEATDEVPDVLGDAAGEAATA